jgi:cyclic pyranopterin monophosphate synthase
MLTHFNAEGQAHMVDVGEKPVTQRQARAQGQIRMAHATLARILEGDTHKGNVLEVARLAGIQGAKRTAELIPLCHPLWLTHLSVTFEVDRHLPGIRCQAVAKTTGQTGVEMEALTAVGCALLTIYDMCKSMDRAMVLEGIGLLEKKGGKSGHWCAPPLPEVRPF